MTLALASNGNVHPITGHLAMEHLSETWRKRTPNLSENVAVQSPQPASAGAAELTCATRTHGAPAPQVKESQNKWALNLSKCPTSTCIRIAVHKAIDKSIAVFRSSGLSERDALLRVQSEAINTRDTIKSALQRDSAALSHNRAMGKREAVLSLTGIVCLVFPILVIFDMITYLLPTEFGSVLASGAQEESTFGAMARFCLGIIDVSAYAHTQHSSSGGTYDILCAASLATILALVRRYARRAPVLRPDQRRRAQEIYDAIEDCMNTRKSKYEHSTEENHLDASFEQATVDCDSSLTCSSSQDH